MEPIDIYQLQAEHYASVPRIMPNVKACVHLENEDDIPFWNSQIQNIAPGEYEYITHSKSKSGDETSGCEQCLKYKPYLSKNFFTCIDSDLRTYMADYDINASQFIAQTYTYSWENHCCEYINLTSRMSNFDIDFDFKVFLKKLSEILYLPLIHLIYYIQVDNTKWNITKFNRCIPIQVKRVDLESNGQSIIDVIDSNIKEAMSNLSVDDSKLEQLIMFCETKGLNKDNAYLHIQGHAIYNLVSYIGSLLLRGTKKSFREILNDFSSLVGYSEIDNVKSDLKSILLG